MGRQTRTLVVAKVSVGRITHDVEMTVADRRHLKCPMLLGKMFLDEVELHRSPLPKSKRDFPQFV